MSRHLAGELRLRQHARGCPRRTPGDPVLDGELLGQVGHLAGPAMPRLPLDERLPELGLGAELVTGVGEEAVSLEWEPLGDVLVELTRLRARGVPDQAATAGGNVERVADLQRTTHRLEAEQV